MTAPLHILAGSVGLLCGYVALFVIKGRDGAPSKRDDLRLLDADDGDVRCRAGAHPGPAIALPMVVVVATMLYWLWRVRLRRSLRGIVLTGQRSELEVSARN